MKLDPNAARPPEAAPAVEELGARLAAAATDLVGLVVVDAQGRITEANGAFLRLVGRERAELVVGDLRWNDLASAASDHAAAPRSAARDAAETWDMEYVRKDGARIPVLVRAAPLDGALGAPIAVPGQPSAQTGWVAVVIDNTLRRHAEDALRDSEERFRLLVSHVGDAVFMLDPAGRVMTWTPAAQRILGYTEAEALALRVEDFYPDGGSDASRTELAACVASGWSELDAWRVAKDGRRLWAHVVTCPIQGRAGELRGFAKIVQDRTALRDAQELLAARAAELARSNEDLESFAMVASHDLQEPLRKLRMFGDRLSKRFAPALEGEAAHLIGRMDEAAARMQTLIEELLRYSRVARRAQPLAVDLGAVARAVIEDLSASLEKAGARVELGALPTVEADPTQMRQLLQNLLSNAIKFRRPGVTPFVKVTGTVVGNEVELRVSDDGIGFEPRYSERIFGLFQRLHGRTEYEGSGMGLPICRRIVERHGGVITAEGRPGAGAVFVIRLPRGQALQRGSES